MLTITNILVIITGFLIRLVIPILITALVVVILKRLDARWQRESQDIRAAAMMQVVSSQPRCWDIKNCSEEQRQNCNAYRNKDVPCWQTFRARNGALREDCIDCGVFKGVPVLVPA